MKNNKLITILILIFLILLGFVSFLIYTLQKKSEKPNSSSVEKIVDNTKTQIGNTSGILGVNPDNFNNQNTETLPSIINNAILQTNTDNISNTINNETLSPESTGNSLANVDLDSISKLDTVTGLNPTKIVESDSNIYNYIISTLTNGKKVLLVPLDKIEAIPFKEYVSQNPEILDPKNTNSDTRLFLYDENTNKLEYVDSQIYYLSDFIYKDKTYWVSMGYRKLELSSPYFKNKIQVNYSGTGLITELKQGKSSRNIFYATSVSELDSYKFFIFDFTKAIDNQDQTIIIDN